MADPIDPTVDYAFRTLFSKPGHEPLLTNLLNAVFAEQGLHLDSVLVVNPYTNKEFEHDKLTIADVKATDNYGRQIQLEAQLASYDWLSDRMLFSWSKNFAGQLEEGEPYRALKPVFGVWVLGRNLFPDSPASHHCFKAHDAANNVELSKLMAIHTLELPKCPLEVKIETDLDTWLYFFRHGKEINPEKPPPLLQRGIWRKAMNVLQNISEHQEERFAYHSRMDLRREQITIKDQMEEDRAAREQAEQEAVTSKQETATAQQETATVRQQAEQAKKEAAHQAEQAKKEAAHQAEQDARKVQLAEKKAEDLRDQLKKFAAGDLSAQQLQSLLGEDT